MASHSNLDRVGLAFARQFYEALVNDAMDPLTMLDDETVYTSGEAEPTTSARQQSVVGRSKINLDLELQVFRGKQLKLGFVETQQTFEEGLLVLVSGAAVESTGPHASSRDFVQTFLLGKDPVEGGFFIRNTVVRFLGRTSLVAPAPAPVADTISAPHSTANATATAAAPSAAKEPAATTTAAAAVAPAVAVAAPVTSASVSAAAPAGKGATGKGGAAAGKGAANGAAAAADGKRGRKGDKKDSAAAAHKAADKTATATATAASVTAPAPAASKNDVAVAPAAASAAAAAPVAAPAAKTQPSSFLDAVRRPGVAAASAPAREFKPKAPKAAPLNGAGAEPREGYAKKGGAAGNNNNNNNNKIEKHAHINPNAQCYVSNIAFGSSNADLEALLGKFGALKSITRPANKGYGFVEYVSNDDAKRAIDNREAVNLMLDGRELKIELRTGQGTGTPAPTKGERRPPRDANSNSRPRPKPTGGKPSEK